MPAWLCTISPQAFCHVNEQFAETVASVYEPGDVVWVFGYHLMLVPSLLRHMLPKAAIGFYLQVGWPRYVIVPAAAPCRVTQPQHNVRVAWHKRAVAVAWQEHGV